MASQAAPVLPPLPGEEPVSIINPVELVDTVVQLFAWGWLCVGIGIILLVPIIFIFLQLRGSHLNR